MVPLAATHRVVIKLGTGILTSGVGQLDLRRIEHISAEVAMLKAEGKQVIVVSSGAVGLGMGRLGLEKKPRRLAALQKCAAVGQSRLTETWQNAFDPHGITVAQLLLTREDVRSRKRHIALMELVEECLSEGIVPIVNENDSISAAEIKFGDNDVLSALVASLSKADLLCILSTARGLENRAGDGAIIPIVENIGPEHIHLAGGTESATGTGGMVTKLEAARIATQSGCAVFIGSGKEPRILTRLFAGNAPGSLFLPRKLSIGSRKRWLAFFQSPAGSIEVDPGAEHALRENGRSLLAKGVVKANGTFEAGDVVAIMGAGGDAIARGVCQFSSIELARLFGKSNAEVKAAFPDRKRYEVIHRDALVLL